MSSPDRRIAELAQDLLLRVGSIAAATTDEIIKQIDYYSTTSVVSRDEVIERTESVLRYTFAALIGEPLDTATAAQTGRARAAAGVPVHMVLAAYRVGFRFVWVHIMAEAQDRYELPADTLVEAASVFFTAQDEFCQALTAAYQEQMTLQILGREQERAALVEALLTGRITSTQRLWEAADVLRLPTAGPYVLVAVQVPELSKLGLPQIENRLDSHGFPSAWHLLPDLQVGIVFLRQESDRQRLIAILDQLATTRIGISPTFGDLARTANSLRLARLALNARPDGPSLVTSFDAGPLSYAAVSAPDVMRYVEETVLGGFRDLPTEERDLLAGTFAAWLDARGSTNDTAKALYCHPNTVRQRLHRIEEHTGRSLTAPRDVAELCLAFEIARRLP